MKPHDLILIDWADMGLEEMHTGNNVHIVMELKQFQESPLQDFCSLALRTKSRNFSNGKIKIQTFSP